MSKIAIVTDSNAGITQEEGQKLGIYIVPMPFYVDGEVYYEGINLDRDTFFEKQDADVDISTSQPSPADTMDMWDKLLEEGYDEVIYIPMSSGLSGTCQTAMALAADYDEKVHVIDNQRISVTLRCSIMDALELAKQGKSAVKIKEILEKERLEASIYITPDTLKHLKKGGRVTPAAAAIGSVLNIKPVLEIQGEKLDAFAKVRGEKKARKTMLEAIRKDLNERFKDAVSNEGIKLGAAYTTSEEEAVQWIETIKAEFPGVEVVADPLSLSVSCHVGRGALGIGIMKNLGKYDD